MGTVDQEIRLIGEGSIDIQTVSLSGMKRDKFAGLTDRGDYLVKVGNIPGTADSGPVAGMLTAIPSKDERAAAGSPGSLDKEPDPLLPSFPEICEPSGPSPFHKGDGRAHCFHQVIVRGGSEDPVFQPIRWSNNLLQIPFQREVHGNTVSHVGMGIEEGRAYPGRGPFRDVFDATDDSSFHHQRDGPFQQLLPDESSSFDNKIPGGHVPGHRFYIG
jgi:hypothetical protein